ncbi:MAG: hypothetical protein LBC74_04900, partial [Planctomycetaceae bacterium]|nr:hypothetical protein [Planctomycetaceae bacterium]
MAHVGAAAYFYQTFRYDVFHVNPPLTRYITGLPILSEKNRNRAEQWIKNVAKIVEKNQLPDGTWERDWGKTGQKGFLYGDKTLDAITLIGHHLEWIAIAN